MGYAEVTQPPTSGICPLKAESTTAADGASYSSSYSFQSWNGQVSSKDAVQETDSQEKEYRARGLSSLLDPTEPTPPVPS